MVNPQYQRLRRAIHPRSVYLPIDRQRSAPAISYFLKEGFGPADLQFAITQVLYRFGYAGISTAISTAFDLGGHAILDCSNLEPSDPLTEDDHNFLINSTEEFLELSNFSEEASFEQWEVLVERGTEARRINRYLSTTAVPYSCMLVSDILSRTYSSLSEWVYGHAKYGSPSIPRIAEQLYLMLSNFNRLILYFHRPSSSAEGSWIFDDPSAIRWLQDWYNAWLSRLAFIPEY